TANVILPGPIDTDIMGGTLTDERKAGMSANIPLQRVGQPEEVAGLISFLISEDSSLVNGTSINVDGGKHMQRSAPGPRAPSRPGVPAVRAVPLRPPPPTGEARAHRLGPPSQPSTPVGHRCPAPPQGADMAENQLSSAV